MDIGIRRSLEHWIKGIIDYPSFAHNLIKKLDDANRSSVRSSFAVDGIVYDLTITLRKRKQGDVPITVNVDSEKVLEGLKKLDDSTVGGI